MRLPLGVASLVTLAVIAAPASAGAQSSAREGGSVERVLGAAGHAVAFTYRRTEAAWLGLGFDLAVGIFPAALAVRTARLMVDAGFARTQRLGPAALILKAGVGTRLDVGPAPAIIPGVQAGIAAIVPLERNAGLRIDLTRRVLLPDGPAVSQWSLGVGISVLSLRSPAHP